MTWNLKPQWNTSSHPHKWLKLQKLTIPSTGEDVGNQNELLCLFALLMSIKCYNHFKGLFGRMAGSTNADHMHTPWLSSSTRLYPTETFTYVYQITCTRMASMAPKQKQSIYPTTVKWTNKSWHSHMTEYYKAMKKNELLPHSTTWMNLTGIMLRERSHT